MNANASLNPMKSATQNAKANVNINATLSLESLRTADTAFFIALDLVAKSMPSSDTGSLRNRKKHVFETAFHAGANPKLVDRPKRDKVPLVDYADPIGDVLCD